MLQVVDQRLLDAIGEHALAEVDLWLTKIAADIPVDAELVDLATQAWLTYGKGRHPGRRAAASSATISRTPISSRRDNGG